MAYFAQIAGIRVFRDEDIGQCSNFYVESYFDASRYEKTLIAVSSMFSDQAKATLRLGEIRALSHRLFVERLARKNENSKVSKLRHRWMKAIAVFVFSVAHVDSARAGAPGGIPITDPVSESAAQSPTVASYGSLAAQSTGAWARRPKTTAEKIRADPHLYDRWNSTQVSMVLGYTFLAAGAIATYLGLALVDAEDRSIRSRGAKTMALGITGIAGGLGFFIYTAMERDRIRRAVASEYWSIYRGRRMTLSIPTVNLGVDKSCRLGFGGRF